MASRNLPPSFFNAHYHAKLASYSEAKLASYSHPEASGLYSAEAYTQVDKPTKINQNQPKSTKITTNIELTIRRVSTT